MRVRKVGSVDLAKAKIAALRMVMPASKQDLGEEAAARMLNRMGDREIEKAADQSTGVVIAGTTHIRVGKGRKRGEWEPVRIVATDEEREKLGGTDAGVMALTDLPAGTQTDLYKAIDSLESDSKGAAESLARFCRGA